MNSKIVSAHQAKIIVDQAGKENKTVVFANGCFDMLHVGHVRYLEEAKAFGHILIVALNGDKSIRMIKGEGRPILPENERAEILSSLTVVDYVVIFNEPDVGKLLLQLKPHIQVKGTDYTEETIPERDVVLGYGGRVKIAGDPKNHSTRDLIARIVEENERHY